MGKQLLQEHLEKLDEQRKATRAIRLHWENKSPAAWLSQESRDALGGQFSKLAVNYPRLVVSSRVDRLKLRGFLDPATGEHDPRLIQLAVETDLAAVSELVHTDRALYGAAYCTVWTGRNGRPVLIPDSPRTATALVDPASGRAATGARLWHAAGVAHLAIFTADKITYYRADQPGQGLPLASQRWTTTEVAENLTGDIPVVPFVRRGSSDDTDGTSAVADILELSDALAKVLADAMVVSEYYAKPRRWATGLEILEDEDGNAVDPFGKSRLLQSEDPETKFGQLAASTPAGQTDLIATITQQIGALTGLPPHYLGLHGDQPANAEGVRAAETQLVTMAYSEQVHLSRPWQQVAGQLLTLDKGVPDADYYRRVTDWESPEIKTPAQAADAAQKLRAIGVPLRSLLSSPLDYAPAEIDAIVQQAEQEQLINSAGAALGAQTRIQ